MADPSQAAMKAVLDKLVDFLAKEYAVIRSVRGDIQYINDELASMQAFLDNLGTSGTDHSVQTKDWMKQVREIAYDIEDCVDEYTRMFPNDPRGDGCWKDFLRWLYDVLKCCPRRDMAAKFAEIKSRVQQVGERRQRYGVSNPSNSAARARGFYPAENQLDERELVGIKKPVGMDKDMEELEKWFTKEESKVVLSIFGFGGVGKTTLAMALYQEHKNKFDRRAMVTVSQSSDLEAILCNILSQVRKANDQQKGSGGWCDNKCALVKSVLGRAVACIGDRKQSASGATAKEHELGEELRGQLHKTSYLLLIDDVWSTTMWHHIYNYLPDTGKGTIMVTTRFEDVAIKCHQDAKEVGRKYKVKVLPPSEARNLFKNVMSESTSSRSSQQLREPPPGILEVCRELPLAIVTMAGHVACNQEKPAQYWERVCESWFPRSVQSLTQEEVTRMLLDYCFHDLTADLKNCSLYLSVFPKGCKISRKRLTRRWIAEGFVSEKHGLSTEDVANAYFKQLIRRRIIRPEEHNKNGKVKTCQTHDMVLEYIVSKSREENFITVVGGHWLAPMNNNKVRRLSIHSSDSKHAKSAEKMNLYRLRSLTVFGSAKQLPSDTFKIGLVQVLDLEDCKDFKTKNVNNICEMLLLLKYLSLRKTDINSIPTSIGNLQYLETLDIRETNVTVLPKAIGQLKRLANILGGHKIKRKAFKLPEGLKKETMKALRLLSGIEVVEGSSIVDDLREFTGLRKLVIYKLSIREKTGVLSSAIQYLGGHFLQSLAIEDECSTFLASLCDLSAPPTSLLALELSGKLLKLPGWISELKYLKKLTLSVTVLRTDTFELLRGLPLFSLTFSFNSSKREPDMESILAKNKSLSDGEITVNDGGFESLKLVCFSAPLLPLLRFSKKAMPNLERLELRFTTFEGIIGIDNLQKLEQLNLVTVKASEPTQLKVKDLIRIANECDKKPKVIQDTSIMDD